PLFQFFVSSTRRHTIFSRDWSSDVCSSDLNGWQVPRILQLNQRPLFASPIPVPNTTSSKNAILGCRFVQSYVPGIYHLPGIMHWLHPVRQPKLALSHCFAFVTSVRAMPARPKTHPMNPNASSLHSQTARRASVQIHQRPFRTILRHSLAER